MMRHLGGRALGVPENFPCRKGTPMEKRTDPVQIIARVGGTDPRRALEVWTRMAGRAGWEVVQVESGNSGEKGTECGTVEVDGLQYRVHVGPRVRHLLVEVVDGRMTERPIFGIAAWAEPVVTPESAPTVSG
jgi:hypothetical protein